MEPSQHNCQLLFSAASGKFLVSSLGRKTSVMDRKTIVTIVVVAVVLEVLGRGCAGNALVLQEALVLVVVVVFAASLLPSSR